MRVTRRGAVRAITATVGAAALAAEQAAEAGAARDGADAPAETQPGANRLWYERPAAEWLEALPIGNGRLGAMVFGGAARERLQLNEGTLWAAGPRDYTHPEALAALPEIRKRVFAGDWRGAQDLVNARFMSVPLRQAPYQTMGSLILKQHGELEPVEAYRRELDLDTAIARTRYRIGGVEYTRETFASVPAHLIVMRLTADRPGRISFEAFFETPQSAAAAGEGEGSIVLTGRGGASEGTPGAVRFAAMARALPEGGEAHAGADGALRVKGANAVTLLISMATSYVGPTDVSGDPRAAARKPLEAAAAKPYARLRQAHLGTTSLCFAAFRSASSAHSAQDGRRPRCRPTSASARSRRAATRRSPRSTSSSAATC